MQIKNCLTFKVQGLKFKVLLCLFFLPSLPGESPGNPIYYRHEIPGQSFALPGMTEIAKIIQSG